MTKLFGVIGNPVQHSLSPRIHQFWYERHDVDAIYSALELQSDTATEDIEALARLGFSGANVTLPHKMAAFAATQSRSTAVERIGAVNTLIRTEERRWHGENTDWTGFLWSLNRLGVDLPDRALIIGAGGAARAVAYALNVRGLQLTLLNRTVEKAKIMAEEMELSVLSIGSLEDLSEAILGHTLVINTVSLGHTGGSIALPDTQSDAVFLDISYGNAAEATLNSAKRAGWHTEDGLPMLVGQAADAFQFWFGINPDREAALNRVRSVL